MVSVLSEWRAQSPGQSRRPPAWGASALCSHLSAGACSREGWGHTASLPAREGRRLSRPLTTDIAVFPLVPPRPRSSRLVSSAPFCTHGFTLTSGNVPESSSEYFTEMASVCYTPFTQHTLITYCSRHYLTCWKQGHSHSRQRPQSPGRVPSEGGTGPAVARLGGRMVGEAWRGQGSSGGRGGARVPCGSNPLQLLPELQLQLPSCTSSSRQPSLSSGAPGL